MGKIKDSNSVVKKKHTTLSIVLGCIGGLMLITSIILFSLSVSPEICACVLSVSLLCFVIVAVVTSPNDRVEPISQPKTQSDNVKLGKYYDPSVNYEVLVQQEKDKKELENLEADWQTSIDYLREQIDLFEGQVITAETEEDKLMIKARLQPMYEQLKVGESFIERFNAANNLPLLRKLYHCGTFVSLEEAEKLRKKYDTILFSQTPDYKRLKRNSNIAIILADIFFIFFFVFLLGSIAVNIGPPSYPEPDAFGLGIAIFLYGSVFTLPITGGVCFWLIPYVVHALMFEDGMSEADQKADRNNAFMGVTASAIAGGIIHHHTKKSKKKE